MRGKGGGNGDAKRAQEVDVANIITFLNNSKRLSESTYKWTQILNSKSIPTNALVHRDLLRPTPIRIFIFDNRVEIISPGALAGGLTEEENGKCRHKELMKIAG